MAETMIERAARLAGPLPGVEIALHYGKPALKVAGKAFAGVPHDLEALWTSCPVEMKPALIEARPDLYFDTDHFSGWPAILVRMEAIDDGMLAARLEAAWGQKAARKLVKAREAAGER